MSPNHHHQKSYLTVTGLALIVAFVLVSFYQYKSDVVVDNVFQNLAQNSEYKTKAISEWIQERKADVYILATCPALAKNLHENYGTLDQLGKDRLLFRLREINRLYGYEMASLVDVDGRIIISTGKSTNLGDHIKPLVTESINTNRNLNSGLVEDSNNRMHLDFVSPIFYRLEDGTKKGAGALVMNADPYKTLVPMIHSWPNRFETARSRLIEARVGGAYLMRDSYAKDAEIKQTFLQPHVMNQMQELIESASKTKSGGKLGFISHSGEEVIVFYQQIPFVDWILLSRVDLSEAMQPVWIQLAWLFFTIVTFLSAVYFLLSRNRASIRLQEEAKYAEDLKRNQEYYFGLFKNAPLPYLSLNEKGELMDVNSAWIELFGYEKDKVLGRPISNFLTSISVENFRNRFPELLEKGQLNEVFMNIKTKSHGVRDVVVEGRVSDFEEKGDKRTHCIMTDITEKLLIDKQLKLASEVYQSLGEGLMVTDTDARIISVNPAFEKILEYSEVEVLGKKPSFLKSGRHDEDFYRKMWHEIDTRGYWQGEIWNRKKSGELFPELLTISASKNKFGKLENYVGVFADISKIKKSEDELEYIANHDLLTGLPNRHKFLSATEFSISHAQRNDQQLAVIMLDLDLFKNVNDSFGHQYGDEVLIEVSSRLKSLIRDIDVLSRLGGDEFVFLVENYRLTEDIARIVQKLIDQVTRPFTLTNQAQVQISCSCGISLYPEHGKNTEELMQHADAALYLAKKRGRGKYEYYNSELTAEAQDRLRIESELRHAIKNNDLTVYYQPQIDIASGKVEGAEALVRWNHPERGLVPPVDFLPIAEESNLIIEIGNWVMYETCRQAKRWIDAGFKDYVFAVNVSVKQLMHSDLYKQVFEVLKTLDLPPENLLIEITETSLMDLETESTVALFERLRGMGVKVAIDDFGTGYSSLHYLQRLNFDVLKIDKSFVDAIPNDEKGMRIVNTIISMAKSLHLKVLAEGIEEQVQLDYLSMRHCDYYQGYLTSKPLSAKLFEEKFLTPSENN